MNHMAAAIKVALDTLVVVEWSEQRVTNIELRVSSQFFRQLK